MKNLNILVFFLIISSAILPASGDLPSHIDPSNLTASTANLHAQQLRLINELLYYRSGVFISLNRGDIKGAMENLDSYMRILRENDNVLIGIEDDVYADLKKSANTLNMTSDQVNQLRSLYEEGRLAYQNNQTGKAVQIALIARNVIGNLSSLQQELIMEAVAQYPGVNVTLYQNGLSSFNSTLKEIQIRWRTVELTLFDETETSLSVSPPEGEFGDALYIKGNLTLPRNGSGVPNASMAIQLDSEVINTTTDRKGRYNFTYKIPYEKPGVYPVQVNFVPVTEPLLASSAKSSFFIKPTNTTLTITASPDYGKFGETIHLSGRLAVRNSSGVAEADIVITLDNKTPVKVKTNKKGSYEYNFTVPAMAQGEHAVKAEFIPSWQPLFGSSSNITITLMPAATTIEISLPEIAYQKDYLNLTGKLLTDDKLDVPDARVNVLLDKKEVGTAVVNRGDFFFSYLIDKNTNLGNNTAAVKFNGNSPFLPSENSISFEIKAKPVSYINITLSVLAIGMIIIFYLRREEAFKLLNALVSPLKARISKKIETDLPPVSHEPLKEPEIKPEEPAVQEPQAQEQDRWDKIYAHLDILMEQKQYKELISFSYKSTRDFIRTKTGIENTLQQTHREFYNLVKSSALAFVNEFKELTELYELAMYSGKDMSANEAINAMDLMKMIHNKISREENE